MFSKWIIDLPGYELYKFGEDKELYRIPYTKGKRSFGLRKLLLNPDRGTWTLNGKHWTKDQLRPHIVDDPDPILLTKAKEMPF